MSEEISKHENDNDHEIWFRCFTAALSGAVRNAPPDVIAMEAGRIADSALEQERQRRREPGYQLFGAGGNP